MCSILIMNFSHLSLYKGTKCKLMYNYECLYKGEVTLPQLSSCFVENHLFQNLKFLTLKRILVQYINNPMLSFANEKNCSLKRRKIVPRSQSQWRFKKYLFIPFKFLQSRLNVFPILLLSVSFPDEILCLELQIWTNQGFLYTIYPISWVFCFSFFF